MKYYKDNYDFRTMINSIRINEKIKPKKCTFFKYILQNILFVQHIKQYSVFILYSHISSIRLYHHIFSLYIEYNFIQYSA